MASSLSDDRIRRLFNVHKILRTGQAFSKGELMARLIQSEPPTNERNLLADIAFLRKLGADIPPGHKHVAFRYRTPFSFLSASNQLDFEEVEEVLAYFRQVYSRMPAAGFLNLDRMYLALQNRADLMAGITVDNMEFQNVEYEGEKWIGPLLKLMRERRVLSFYYQPFGIQESQRFLYPLLLKEYNYRWFLIGINPEKGRLENMALDRITRALKAEDILYQPIEIPDLKTLYRDVLGVSLEGGPASRISIRIRKPRAYYVKTKPWHPSQKIVTEDDSSIVFTWFVFQNRELKTRVMEYLPDAEIIEPEGLRDWLREALSAYSQRAFPSE
jgi:predicted DNA-binding transcriptional regulator YafY